MTSVEFALNQITAVREPISKSQTAKDTRIARWAVVLIFITVLVLFTWSVLTAIISDIVKPDNPEPAIRNREKTTRGLR